MYMIFVLFSLSEAIKFRLLFKEAAEKQQQENDKKNAAKEKVLVSGMSND